VTVLTQEALGALERCRSLLDGGRLVEAGGAFATLPESTRGHAEFHALEGELALAAGDAGAALAAFARALDLDHANARYHRGEAAAYRKLHALTDAEDSLRLALAFDPACTDARLELSDLLGNMGRAAEARDALLELQQRDPERVDVLLHLARAHNRCGDVGAAVACYESALQRSPGNTAANVNLGLIWLLQRADPHRAEAYMRAALAADPACHEARANLGLALHDQGRWEEALALYESAVRQYPGIVEYRWNRGLAHLLNGRFAEGWEGYALRFEREGGRLQRSFPLPEWDGSDPRAAGILVYGEQGLGDEIMFASCIPDLLAAGARVVLECNSRLEGLFRRSFPAAAVHGKERDAPRDWIAAAGPLRWQVPIGSLAARFRRSSSAFPQRMRYLEADERRVAHYRSLLRGLGSGARIGISWRGGTRSTRAELRSLPQDLVAMLLALPCRWVGLQHAMRAEEAPLLQRLAFADADATTDADDMAALVASLDAVVTVDNSVAHFAGALGVPAWVLLCSSPDWRWQAEGETSPWYPSVKLVRQAAPGDWRSAIDRLRGELAACVPADPLT
jgi:tetratricopeptide (TPR) repeat protein